GPQQGSEKKLSAFVYECKKSAECQWQKESEPKLCPPRLALKEGIDPKYCLY
ncbi:unnamed protein product, partial [marine sediment metagenome]